MKTTTQVINTRNLDECSIDRYDILMALMRSSQTQDLMMRMELSKLISDISLAERRTRQYVNSINIQISGNEKLLKYIEESA